MTPWSAEDPRGLVGNGTVIVVLAPGGHVFRAKVWDYARDLWDVEILGRRPSDSWRHDDLDSTTAWPADWVWIRPPGGAP